MPKAVFILISVMILFEENLHFLNDLKNQYFNF